MKTVIILERCLLQLFKGKEIFIVTNKLITKSFVIDYFNGLEIHYVDNTPRKFHYHITSIGISVKMV